MGIMQKYVARFKSVVIRVWNMVGTQCVCILFWFQAQGMLTLFLQDQNA